MESFLPWAEPGILSVCGGSSRRDLACGLCGSVDVRAFQRQLGISEQSRRRHLQTLLISEIERLFPNQARVSFVRNRPVLKLDDGTTVAITICQCNSLADLCSRRNVQPIVPLVNHFGTSAIFTFLPFCLTLVPLPDKSLRELRPACREARRYEVEEDD